MLTLGGYDDGYSMLTARGFFNGCSMLTLKGYTYDVNVQDKQKYQNVIINGGGGIKQCILRYISCFEINYFE